MNKSNDKYKYKKYKEKYEQLLINKYKFYFIHKTKNYENLLKILKDGYLTSGQNVDKKYRFWSGEIALEDIYMNIIFDNLRDNSISYDMTLIFDPTLIFDYEMDILKGWGVNKLVHIDINDTKLSSKMKKIYKFIKNPDLHEKLLLTPKILQHEIRIKQNISLDKYLRAIVCHCNDNTKVMKLLENYPHVKIITNDLLPDFQNL